ncbi:hypothetical protein [Paenibacillus anseongense]|uniref:VOC family protein n=1 Tax=Paenibacillus anseongense TaxID=2682845 RepID=UPI002DBECABA|nr:hypothetical protein [Paenibacillus anseongense]MEC0269936.1 hypothetical protein [Paenibacillus anseongense]
MLIKVISSHLLRMKSPDGGAIVVPKITMPGMGYLAYFTDPSGMLLGVSQADPNAR